MQVHLFSLEAISMEPVKEKLRNLKSYLPDKSQSVYDLAKRLAGTLKKKLVPEGFNLAAEAAVRYIYDYCEAYGEPVPVNLRDNIPEIARAVCPADFARRVEKIHIEVGASIREI